jgi:hypothetical protein
MSLLRRSPRLAVAGALLTGGFVALAASPASAVGVATEAELRAAFADVSETSVVLTANIDLVDCVAGDVTRPVTANSLTLSGPFTIRQTCADERVIGSDDEPLGSIGALSVVGVTITGGDETDVTSAHGGGIYWDGDVVLEDATITANSATAPFGGLGGGVFATGEVLVSRSTISDNVAGSNGNFGGLAGGLSAGGGASITDSTLSGNIAAGGAQFGGTGGAIFGNSNVLIIRSTIAGNAATVSGDGTGGGNGGGVVINADLAVYNSTVTANAATGMNGSNGGLAAGGDTAIAYSTIVGNSASSRANLQDLNSDPTFGVDVIFGSVISDPLGGGTNCGSASDAVSQGYNHADDASCNLTATGDRQSAVDPLLGALAANGGPTATRLPAATSPLLDAIPPAACQTGVGAGIVVDQRGIARPQGTGCDIGAVEVVVTVPPSTTTTSTPGSSTTTPNGTPTVPGQSPVATPVRVTPRFAG